MDTMTLQGIFQSSFEAYAASRKLPLKHHKAAKAIMSCRTPDQGGHIQRCPDDHESHVQYHSCRHRSCPQCNALPKEQWVQKQFSRLLSVDHYHLIFTLPHELLPLWRYNQHWFSRHLFKVVSETLMTLSQDHKHLGALPGMIMSLHTWGRNLSLHPHIHCLMSGGGLTSDGQWKSVNHDFLFPSRVVRALYRGRFVVALRKALRAGKLALPEDTTMAMQQQVFDRLMHQKWNVRIQPPYHHGNGVMKYLSRYVKGGPISNQRILSMDDSQVRFKYRDHRDQQQKIQQLSTTHFIERILDHIAEPKQHVIRHYGLYGHQARAKRNRCRVLLEHSPEQEPRVLTWNDLIDQHPDSTWGKCQQCGQRLVRGREVIKNSIYEVSGSAVQQGVATDIDQRLMQKAKPPDQTEARYFFGMSMPLN